MGFHPLSVLFMWHMYEASVRELTHITQAKGRGLNETADVTEATLLSVGDMHEYS